MSWWQSKQNSTTATALRVSASANYNQSSSLSPTVIPVNSETPIIIESDLATTALLVRIKHFTLSAEHKANNSKSNSPYFDSNLDANISIQISLTPKTDEITGASLLFGNDFGYPIRDFLPYGTGTGLKLFQWYVDPSVDGDLYSENPFLYGKALSSFNVINDNAGAALSSERLQENLENDHTDELPVPSGSAERQKFFRDSKNLSRFKFKKGVTYNFDFYSGLISFEDSNFNISLPGGFQLNLSKILNEKFSSVRYVLKYTASDKVDADSGTPLLVISFELIPLKGSEVDITKDETENENQDQNENDSENDGENEAEIEDEQTDTVD